jgi:uncharacterized protein (DUF305 family)
VILAGCANDSGTSGIPMEHGSANASAGPSAGAFNDTRLFVQTMLPHHDQAVSMSDLLLAKRGFL